MVLRFLSSPVLLVAVFVYSVSITLTLAFSLIGLSSLSSSLLVWLAPTELIRRLNMPKAKVFRYLNALIKHGWLVRKDGGYYLAATIFLVYRVREFGDYAVLEVLNDKGAIVDQRLVS